MENINKWTNPKLKKYIKYSDLQIWNQLKTETLLIARLKQLKKRAVIITKKTTCLHNHFIIFHSSIRERFSYSLIYDYIHEYNCLLCRPSLVGGIVITNPKSNINKYDRYLFFTFDYEEEISFNE